MQGSLRGLPSTSQAVLRQAVSLLFTPGRMFPYSPPFRAQPGGAGSGEDPASGPSSVSLISFLWSTSAEEEESSFPLPLSFFILFNHDSPIVIFSLLFA